MNNKGSYDEISRRAFIIGGLKLISFGALIARLGYLQLFKFGDYSVLSDKNRIRVLPIIPSRGKILDCKNRPIAKNKYIYKLVLDDEYKQDLDKVYSKILKILDRQSEERPDKKAKTERIVLVDDLTWPEIAKLSIFVSSMPGVSIEKYTDRDYANNYALSHVLGYTVDDPDVNILGYRAGVLGVEKECNDDLRGELGQKSVEVNVIGKLVRVLDTSESVPGKSVKLSIDLDLQEHIYNMFAKYKAGACVVMDVFTGQIKALVSYPGYSSKAFANGGWEDLQKDPLKSLMNRVTCGEYPPGSIFKLISAIAFLESGAFDKSYKTQCSQVYRFGDHDFHCWKKGGHGIVDIKRALVESCDVFFYTIAKQLGINTLASYARLFGLGDRTSQEFTYERKGLVPDPDWKRAVYRQPWYPYETILTAIGQGSVLTTPIQLATMTAMIANGGFRINPTFSGHEKLDLLEKIGVSESTLLLVTECMNDVCNNSSGTAYWGILLKRLGIKIAGKTGTSQVVTITKKERESGEYKNFNSKPWEQRDHALFVGFAPLFSPKYSVSVILEHEISGSKAAAPFAAEVLKCALAL